MSEKSNISFIQALCLVGNHMAKERPDTCWHDDLINLFSGTHRDRERWYDLEFIRDRLPFFIECNDMETMNDVYEHQERAPFAKDAIIPKDEYGELLRACPSDVFNVSLNQVILCHDTYWELIYYLRKTSRYTLRCLDDDRKPPKFNPFEHRHFGTYYKLDIHDSVLETQNASYDLTIEKKALKIYLAKGTVALVAPSPRTNSIDTAYFNGLMHKHKWDWTADKRKPSNPKIIGTHGGKSNYILTVTRPIYLERYPHHKDLQNRSFTDNLAIGKEFSTIQNEIRYGIPDSSIVDLDDKDRAFIEWLARKDRSYKWKWHVVLSFRKGTTKEEAEQAFIVFMAALTEKWHRYKRVRESDKWTETSQLPRLVIMEKGSGAGNRHFHIFFGDEIVQSMRDMMASLWEKTEITGTDGTPICPCERPTDNENGVWFEKIYSIYGLVRYVLKEETNHSPDAISGLSNGIVLMPEDIGYD